jgi:hypothetical protein
MSPEEITAAAERVAVLRQEIETAEGIVERALREAITAWEYHERVPCGHTGGWSFDRLEAGVVHLTHDCFYAHRYDLHHSYSTSVPLGTLLDGVTPRARAETALHRATEAREAAERAAAASTVRSQVNRARLAEAEAEAALAALTA